MKKLNILFFSWCFLGVLNQGLAQTELTLQGAFELALQNNFSLQIASNDYEIAKKNNQIGNAGMLPTVLGTVNQDQQVVDTKQKFLSGAENNRDGAKSSQLNGNVELSWTIFNGMKMFATKSKLQELEAMGQLKLRQQIENTLTRVAKSYFDVVLAKEQLKSGKLFVEISQKRLEVAQAKLQTGKSSKSEVLNAQVNLNSDIAGLKRLETQYKNSQLSLNQLLGMDLKFTFVPTDSLPPGSTINFESLRENALSNNSGVRMAKVNQTITFQQLREIKGERYPSLQLKSGYNASQQQSEAGFLSSAQNMGFHYGAGLSLNLFNGFDVNRRIGNAKLQYKNAELLMKDSLLKLDIALTQAYNIYLTNLDLYQFEQSNLTVAQQNFDIAKVQYEQGIISNNDLRIAQVNYLQNVNRLLVAAYDARLSETELQRLSGGLIK
jgi:outer membrane protein